MDSESQHEMARRSLRIVMMGTGPFAVPTFRALLESPHQVVALVTRPERPVHTHRKPTVAQNPMKAVAVERGVPVLDPESVNAPSAQEALAALRPDLLLVCDYGQILSRQTLGLARLGGINLHGSLLPAYRGAAPVNWAIYHGETETGVTVIHMTPQLDAGPCLLQRRTEIGPNETAVELEPRLAELGVPAVLEAIEMLTDERPHAGIPQDPKLATKAPRLKKSDGLVDWTRTSMQIRNQVRAFVPWPKTYTFWRHGEGEPVRLILEEVVAASDDVLRVTLGGELKSEPGTVLAVDREVVMVVCGLGAVLIQRLQPAGKRGMTIAEFLRGNEIKPGERLG